MKNLFCNVAAASVALLTVGWAAETPGLPVSWQQREQQRIATIEMIAPSVVCVMPPGGEGGGSGVLVSADGYAITNFHVVSGSGSFFKCGLNNGHVYDAVLVGVDPTGDVAMIKLLGRTDFPCATAGDSDKVQVGDEVMALGNPFLLADNFSPTVTCGIVSGVHRYQYPAGTFLEYSDCIQIDASINPGNSGGPLFDIQGRWIGINGRASFEQRGRVNVGAAYAISVRQIQLFLEHLRSGRIVDHGNAEFAVATDAPGRVVVTDVNEISEAARRGLKSGDELISFGGRGLTSANDFKNILGTFPAGVRVPLTFRNRSGLQSTTIRLLPLHEFSETPELPAERRQGPGDPSEPEAAPAPEVPPEYADLFEARDGFANYAFNRRFRDQFLTPLDEALSDREAHSRTWVLQLTAEGDDTPIELIAGEDGAGLSVGGGIWHQDAAALNREMEPETWPGLLIAAIQWHRLFDDPREGWPETIYIGAETHLPTEERVHVVETRDGPLNCRWLFQDGTTYPFGVDVETGSGVDECRLLFRDWSTTSPIPVPGAIGVIVPETGEVKWLTTNQLELRE